jgi:translation initiation factor 2B subunit (eIF-2B alpha/beta/delta family)
MMTTMSLFGNNNNACFSKVDMAIVGAEAVVEAGGVINRTGTFQLGIVCKAMNTPL